MYNSDLQDLIGHRRNEHGCANVMNLQHYTLTPSNLKRKSQQLESGKQPTTGSHIQRKLYPVPVSLNEAHEWCKWIKSSPVTAIKISCCECYEWSPKFIQVFSVIKHSFLEGKIQSRMSTSTSNQSRSCELCEWCQSTNISSRLHISVPEAAKGAAQANNTNIEIFFKKGRSHVMRTEIFILREEKEPLKYCSYKHLTKGGCWKTIPCCSMFELASPRIPVLSVPIKLYQVFLVISFVNVALNYGQ